MSTDASLRPTPIDMLSSQAALAAMLESQTLAVKAITPAIPHIEAAAKRMAQTVAAGRTLIFAAAGSSGLMALSDASELPGTFGIPVKQIRVAMAGGVPVDGHMPGDTEDETDSAQAVAATMVKGDLAIIVSASGTTPYALAMANAAKERGVLVVAIANVPHSALLNIADIPICLPTAPEVINGSTRLGAGTAQKIALNMISTLAGILLGHVHNGLMVNLNADNIKLRKRAETIVTSITGASADHAKTALQSAGCDTKLAILIAAGSTNQNAKALLTQHNGHLAPCLAALGLTD